MRSAVCGTMPGLKAPRAAGAGCRHRSLATCRATASDGLEVCERPGVGNMIMLYVIAAVAGYPPASSAHFALSCLCLSRVPFPRGSDLTSMRPTLAGKCHGGTCRRLSAFSSCRKARAVLTCTQPCTWQVAFPVLSTAQPARLSCGHCTGVHAVLFCRGYARLHCVL